MRLAVTATLIALAALAAPARAATNLPISCARAAGLQANTAACTDAEQQQRPASADDVVLACAKATACGWYDAELTWRKWSTVPADATVAVCPADRQPGAMSCPGAQSPVWGGLAFVPKAQVAVAAVAAAPPPEGTTIRIVSWTNTATCPISGTRVQASLQPDFAAWRQWETTGAVTNIRLTTAPDAGPLYWRAATLCPGPTAAAPLVSDWSTPAVRTEMEWAISTTPPCEPFPIVGGSLTATEAWYDIGDGGAAMYFACKLPDGTWKDAGTYGLIDLPCIGRYALASLIVDTATRQAEKAKVWAECLRTKPGDEAFRPKWIALRDAHRPAAPVVVPPSAWKVASNGGIPTRPAVALVSGSRTSTTVGRVAVGAACDCNAYKSVSGTATYCAVTGQPNLATAITTDVLGASAAVCSQ